MDTLSKSIDDLLNLGDPEIRTWFLVRQKSFPFIIIGIYIIFSTIIGPSFMKHRERFELKKILIAYNFLLVFIYFSFLSVIARNILNFTYHQFCHGTVILKGDVTYTLASACWVVYVVKYVELLDTVFFVLRKKQNQITFLHVVHHILVPLCCWLVLRTERSGMVAIPAVINAFVHVIMYSYYGLSAMGPQVKKYLWWKKYLTQLQMTQFLLIIVFALVVVPISGCKMVITSYIIQFTLAPLFLYLFYMYYRRSFHLKRIPPKNYGKKSKDLNSHELQINEKRMHTESKNKVARDSSLMEASKKLK